MRWGWEWDDLYTIDMKCREKTHAPVMFCALSLSFSTLETRQGWHMGVRKMLDDTNERQTQRKFVRWHQHRQDNA